MRKFRIKVNGREYAVEVSEEGVDKVQSGSMGLKVERPDPPNVSISQTHGGVAPDGAVTAPISGRILKVFVEEGQEVKAEEKLFALEAMKMENEIYSPASGKVVRVFIREGEDVEEGKPLCEIS